MTFTDYLTQLALVSDHFSAIINPVLMHFLYTWLAKKLVEMEHGVNFMSYTVTFLHT